MAHLGKPLTVFGDGSQVRSFCHVDDAVEGVCRVLLGEKSSGEVFNIGNDTEPISITDLAKRVIEESGKDLPIEYIEMKNADREASREIFMRRPDISKAREILGYEPTVSIREGIRRLIDKADSIPESWIEPLATASTST